MSGNERTRAAKSCQELLAPPKSTQERGAADAPKNFQERAGTLRPGTPRPTSAWICPTHRAVPTKRVPTVHQDRIRRRSKSVDG